MKTTKWNKTRIMLKVARGYAFVQVEEMLYFEAADKYAELHFLDGRICMVFHSLCQLESMLGCDAQTFPFLFQRIHRRYIVALHHAEFLNDKLELRLLSGPLVRVSRSQMPQVKACMMAFNT